ncbi:MAG TPA: peptidylprolyl isomerase [Thiotrichaceae bacterium]|jgi:FKBP-type peptidyl-prolyl cis-trans isomerase SlyD|nr:peptidylprolyl isomerase [Thiotrichaceae bacterium]HIM08332.1 peptidylprolyl isomerase [Gammaproteobacteria bacterium]
MQLTKNKVAVLNFTLKNKDGEIIDETNDGTFTYLHGARNLISGLENALENKQAGDKISVVIEPKDAYGEHDQEKVERVPLDMFPPEVEIREGLQFDSESADGEPIVVTVIEIDAGEVVVDGNHSMAGVELHFDVELVEVREATAQELEHGHVHGPHGHDH